MEEALRPAPQLPFWHNYREVSFEDLCDPNHRITRTKLTCILLQVKKHDNKQLQKYSVYQNKGRSPSYFSNVLSLSYDRLFLFGLVYKKGFCMAYLSLTATSSSYFVSKLDHNKSNIGDVVVLLEPQFDGKSLGKNSTLPLITTERKLLPIDLQEQFPSPFDVNLSVGQTRYFMLYESIITLEGLVVVNAHCKGIECDRLLLQGKDTQCGCFHNKLLSPLTIKTVVIVEQPRGNILFSCPFQSYKLTQLLLTTTLENSLSEFEDDNLETLRTSVENMITYINDNGGWSVCGWMRLGGVVDASDVKSGEEVASDTINPHIVSLKPNNNTEGFILELNLLRYRTNSALRIV
jgi:hypothetical protein